MGPCFSSTFPEENSFGGQDKAVFSETLQQLGVVELVFGTIDIADDKKSLISLRFLGIMCLCAQG